MKRLFMWIYELGYSLWVKIGKGLYYDEVYIVRGDDKSNIIFGFVGSSKTKSPSITSQ